MRAQLIHAGLLLTIVILKCSSFSLANAEDAIKDGPKPNFVLILMDDMGYGDITPFGSKLNRTPNLERMAKEGMRLTSFYASPVCTASRAQFLTGCYAKRISFPGVLKPAAAIGIHKDEKTLPQLLKKQGYATMIIGKWHLGDHPDFLPTKRGFDNFFGVPYSNDMAPFLLLRDDKPIEKITGEGQKLLTERYTAEALKFIKANKDKPFFLYLPHTAVHKPINPGPAFSGKSPHGFYSDWVEECDWSTGKILDLLRELKLDKRTLVLFTSDNGGTNLSDNGPLRGIKGSTLEGGMRVPTLAWWPGKIPAGTSCDAVAANIDVLPTFVKLAGGEVPKARKIDGKDLWPILSGKSQESPHEAFFYFAAGTLEAVRSGPWKLRLKNRQLHNVAFGKDMGEKDNVASQHPDVVKRLRGYAAKMDGDLGISGKGPGVRPPARTANPQRLRLGGKAGKD